MVDDVTRPAAWWTREHPILLAAVAAENRGDDIAEAMAGAAAAAGITTGRFQLLIRRLHDDRLVDSVIQENAAGEVMVTHPRRVLPAGLRAAEEEPPAEHLAVFVTAAERAALEPVLAAVRTAVDEKVGSIEPDRLADIEAQLETIHGQLRSPTPRRRIVGEVLKTLRNLTENVVAAGIWLGVHGLIGGG